MTNRRTPGSGSEAVRDVSPTSLRLMQVGNDLNLISMDDGSTSTPKTKLAPIDETGLFNTSPITALELLCENVDRLAKPADDSHHPEGGAFIPGDSAQEESESTEERSASQTTSTKLHYTSTSERAGINTANDSAQLKVLAKRFLSKRVPPITMKGYLLRLHRFCPMSTAVYLATSVYITKIVVIDRVLCVTPKNAHRLVLAGLRVAVKILEDLGYYSQSRFARVGGVSERELTRLEVGFCFLVDFELRVDAQMLTHEVCAIRKVANSSDEHSHKPAQDTLGSPPTHPSTSHAQ